MNQEEEKWAVFWCDLLSPVIYGEIEAEGINQFLKILAKKELVFPDGKVGKPSISRLRRKLNKYKTGGFQALHRKPREDKGKPRVVLEDVIAKAIELKKEQPYRSYIAINRFLGEMYGVTLARSTLYWHLQKAGATKLKLDISQQKVRKRWTMDHTHDLWVGDFEEGPYVSHNDEILPTYLSAFIDCHSRWIVDARYYIRQNLDVLVDSLVRALAKHGAPLKIYMDNAKVYHAIGLKAACYKSNIHLIYRPKGDPAPGGIIEKFFQTGQGQFESEVRAGDMLTLDELNRAFSAWLSVSYHQEIHSETHQSPQERYHTGFKVIRNIDIKNFIASFMVRIKRTVNRTFSDVQLNKKFYRVDSKYRGDRVEVRSDPFKNLDTVEIYSIDGQYLQEAKQHDRSSVDPAMVPPQPRSKPKHNYIDLLQKQHDQQLKKQTTGIDYRKLPQNDRWPFHDFAKSFAELLGQKGGISSFNTGELEKLKKFYNQSVTINRHMLKKAFENAYHKSLPYVVHELKLIINQKEDR